jgi:hypothetical protein
MMMVARAWYSNVPSVKKVEREVMDLKAKEEDLEDGFALIASGSNVSS